MSKYLPSFTFTTKFEDDQVVVTMSPMSRQSFFELLSIQGASEEDANERKMSVYGVATKILETHVLDIKGLRDANGDAVGKEALLDVVYFAPLVLECFAELSMKSGLGKATPRSSEEKSLGSIAELK